MCFVTLKTHAQKTEPLLGKWKYADIADKEKLDSKVLEMAKMTFAKAELEFTPDVRFTYNPLGDNQYSNYSGTWTMNKERTRLTVQISNTSSPEKTQSAEWEIKGLTEKELELNMGNAVVVFSRPKTEQSTREERIEEELKKSVKELSVNQNSIEPTIEIKTKTHLVKVYSGWNNIFGKNTEAKLELLSIASGLKSSELFSEAPDGWIKDDKTRDKFNGTISLSFKDSPSETTIAQQKQSFIEYCAEFADPPTDKIKFLEEEVILADGRKGILLFYYSDKVRLEGFQLNCEVYSVSNVNPKYLTIYRYYMSGGTIQNLAEKDFPVWKDYFKKIMLTIKPNTN